MRQIIRIISIVQNLANKQGVLNFKIAYIRSFDIVPTSNHLDELDQEILNTLTERYNGAKISYEQPINYINQDLKPLFRGFENQQNITLSIIPTIELNFYKAETDNLKMIPKNINCFRSNNIESDDFRINMLPNQLNIELPLTNYKELSESISALPIINNSKLK